MCGIAGVVKFDGLLDDRIKSCLGDMNRTLAHRGPDDSGTQVIGPCGLTHRRLSVIDLTSAGRQPMADGDKKIWIVYNGEIYNFQELRRDYELDKKGYRFRSRTDVEVLLYLYQELGVDCLKLLNGMFALAVWDQSHHTLHLARDGYGIKPLFYTQKNGAIWFASEIKALLTIPGFKPRPSLEALHHYLSLGFIPDKLTAFEGIHELRPGYRLSFTAGNEQPEMVRFYDVTYQVDPHLTEKEAIQKSRVLLEEAVQRQLISDVPVGVMLSGGIDSSAITLLMARIMGSSDFHTFSLGFRDKSFDESCFAKMAAHHVGTHHHEILVTPEKVSSLLQTYISHIDEPYADGSAIPNFLLSQQAKDLVTVLLSGEGGDELFSGYDTHLAYKIRKAYRAFPGLKINKILRPFVDLLPVSEKKLSFEFKAKRFVRGCEMDVPVSHYFWRHILSEKVKKEVLHNTEIMDSFPPSHSFFSETFKKCSAEDELNCLLYIDYSFHLPDDLMVKNDRMTMAHSLEARVPFTDNLLWEFLSTVPVGLKLKGLRKKHILRSAVGDLLPPKIVSKKKVGLEIPYPRWLRKEFANLVEEKLSEKKLEETGLFNPPAVRKFWQQHLEKKYDHGRFIWCILNYMIWHELYISSDGYKNHLQPPREPRMYNDG
ncbi:MAG: asparagine synthase (glutamine-hydrolyzing) [Candidatus Aminicenantes bacterium]